LIVAGVVIETTAGAAPRVAARLRCIAGVELHGSDGDHRLAAVLTGDDGAALEALAERLVEEDAEVLGVLPTYVADERDYARAPKPAERSRSHGGARPPAEE
jgi:hypothetical protein